MKKYICYFVVCIALSFSTVCADDDNVRALQYLSVDTKAVMHNYVVITEYGKAALMTTKLESGNKVKILVLINKNIEEPILGRKVYRELYLIRGNVIDYNDKGIMIIDPVDAFERLTYTRKKRPI